jgi:predicted nucleic acid-binding protein
MANVLIIAERRKRITSVEVNSHLSFFQTLPIEIDEATVNQAWNGTRILAQAHQLTIYDAAYLELAIRRGLPLATLDTALQSACKLEKVRLATLI